MSATRSDGGATAMSQLDVPRIFTIVPGAVPDPTAPRWASNAPPATGIPWGNSSRAAHSAVRPPTVSAIVTAADGRVRRTRTSAGSTAARNSSSGYPPHDGWNIALWPAAQMQRAKRSVAVRPVSTAGIQSAHSTHVWAASKTSGASRRQRRTLDQNHSEE